MPINYAAVLRDRLPPAALRLVLEYSREFDDADVRVGAMLRITVWETLHDAYVLYETDDHVFLLLKCGAVVRVKTAGLGGLSWLVPIDTNPNSCSALSPNWFLLAMDRPRSEQVSLIDVHLPPPPRAPAPANSPPSSCHRRVRLYTANEDRSRPVRAPAFVFLKMVFPYFALRVLPRQLPSSARPRSARSAVAAQTQLHQDMLYGYMRESAAYSVLHLCLPKVAPVSFYSAFNEVTGSYSILLEDLTNWPEWTPIQAPLPRKTLKEEEQQEVELREQVGRVTAVFAALAALHGRFFKDHKGTVPVSRDVLTAFVHPKLYYANWEAAIPQQEADARRRLREVYGMEDAGQEPQPGGESLTRSSSARTESSCDTQTGSRRRLAAFPPSCRIADLVSVPFDPCSSLTLIHGRLHHPRHIRRHPDPRGVPGIVLLDWKYSGIGPCEVDLLQALMLVPAAVRRRQPEVYRRCLSEYLETVRVLYPASGGVGSLPDLLCRLRQMALLMISTDPMDWNGQGEVQAQFVQLHHELCDITTAQQLEILRSSLKHEMLPK